MILIYYIMALTPLSLRSKDIINSYKLIVNCLKEYTKSIGQIDEVILTRVDSISNILATQPLSQQDLVTQTMYIEEKIKIIENHLTYMKYFCNDLQNMMGK